MNDLGYIKDPMTWVSFLCPIKKRNPNGGWHTAYLFCNEPVIRHGNICNPKPDDREEKFESHEAILAAGWQVD